MHLAKKHQYMLNLVSEILWGMDIYLLSKVPTIKYQLVTKENNLIVVNLAGIT